MFSAIFTNRVFAGLFVSFAALLATGTAVGQSSSGYEGGMVNSHSPSYGYGSYGSYHASTAAEGFLRGRAAVIDALGNFKVNDAQAGQSPEPHSPAALRSQRAAETILPTGPGSPRNDHLATHRAT